MYRYSNGQISLADFKQPVGMNLKESNRWVKKAQTIPWPEIEKRCAALFTNRKGNVAKPLRLALGACIIQAEYGYSDEETALQIHAHRLFEIRQADLSIAVTIHGCPPCARFLLDFCQFPCFNYTTNWLISIEI